MAASQADIEEFLTGPLVAWLATCVKKPDSLQVYDTLFDGSAIAEVLLQIDPQPSQPVPSPSSLQGLSITAARVKIFHSILLNIRTVYEDELKQVIVSLPDCVILGRSSGSQAALEQMKLLLLLLLGCAVQAPTQQHFITKIMELPDPAMQHEIMACIQQVIEEQTIVLTQRWVEQSPERLYSHIRNLTKARDKMLHQWIIDLSQEFTASSSASSTMKEGVESNHFAVELADWKAKVRKLRQESEEKSEILSEFREELNDANNLISKLKAENSDLLTEARLAKSFRDEVDAMRERAERADRLETEAQRFREKLADAEFYKVRVDELREDNRVLLETREMLESQLAKARQRADHVLELEAELLSSKQTMNDLVLERDAAREKIQELIEENFQLQQVTKSALQENSVAHTSVDSIYEESSSADNSLSEQLTTSAQARALRLELENKKLLSTIDSLKEDSLRGNAHKLLDLEKEKKKMLIKCEQLQENCERLSQQNSELEALFKNAIQENRKLQSSIDGAKVIAERQSQDLQNERVKVSELEKNIESLTKEKQRVQMLCDTIKKRADDAEKAELQISEQLQIVQVQAEEGKKHEKVANELQSRIVSLEKEGVSMQKEVTKIKELLETKDVILDKEMETITKLQREIKILTEHNENALCQLEKMQGLEQKTQELMSQASVHAETISTLQGNLIAEKVNNERYKNGVEKLGLNLDVLDNDINIIWEKMLSIPNVAKVVSSILDKEDSRGEEHEPACKLCAKSRSREQNPPEESPPEKIADQKQQDKLSIELSNVQLLNNYLQTVNAKMQVDISTLKSQINSLQTQQTALQLANSQLVAEKEELSKQQQIQYSQHDTLLHDQVTLRTLHEQLNIEYEQLKNEEDSLKKLNRDLRSEIRTLKETCNNQHDKLITMEAEKKSLKDDAKNLNILRAEHSKLKDDFRNLFAANDRLKVEYRAVQEELKSLRTESRTLRLGQTEMQGELNTTSDIVTGLQSENKKLQLKCDMLLDMNHSLDSDRRALMDHVSQLLSQYHSLLTHSLEDKQHYHLEEKLYTDKVNNLCRQKEKLEEKIMEHYRKLDNASSKKKSFGATLVKRVRKAGSDIINKVPSRNRRSWQEDTSRLTQSQFTIGGGSGESANNDSDNSLEESGQKSEPFKRSTGGSLHGHRPRDEVALRRSHRDMAAHRNSISADFPRDPAPPISLGSVGSRRTVYLSEDEPASSTPAQMNNQNAGAPPPPLLVYNKISTIIGAEQQQLQQPSPQQAVAQQRPPEDSTKEGDEKRKLEYAKETAVWYEYGCV